MSRILTSTGCLSLNVILIELLAGFGKTEKSLFSLFIIFSRTTKVKSFFERLKVKFPQTISAIHGLGAMLAIELVDADKKPATDLTKKILHFANENGLILISAGVNGNYIRILSPLVITD